MVERAMVVEGERCAIKHAPSQAQPGHIRHCQKALLNARMYVASYQGLDIAIKKKQGGESLLHT